MFPKYKSIKIEQNAIQVSAQIDTECDIIISVCKRWLKNYLIMLNCQKIKPRDNYLDTLHTLKLQNTMCR